MVKIIRILIVSCVAGTMLTCGVNRHVGIDAADEFNVHRATKKEAFDFGMWDLIRAYTDTYRTPPASVEDLIVFYEKMDESTLMIRYPQYKYLKKHREKLRVHSDEHITTIYYQRGSDNHVVASASY